ncbi:MAG: amidohydrolase family protein, partial [Bacteroidota bacterium]
MKRMLLLGMLFSLFSLTLVAQNPSVLLENISVIDVKSGKVEVQSVLVKGEKIKSIRSKISAPKDAQIIDGTGKFLIPGLVDAHIHLFQSGGIFARPDALDLRKYKPYEEEVEWVLGEAGDFLKRYLRCGITTVMDVGGPMSNYDLRTEFSDHTAYPNLYLTGPLISTYQPAALNVKDPPIIQVASPEEAREQVRKQLPSKPDFIKIWYISTGAMPADSTYDMVAATIDESHKHGLKVAVHATELRTAKLALKAGADFLVHSVEDEVAD